MMDDILHKNVGIVGAGKFCLRLLQFVFKGKKSDQPFQVLGIADINPEAPGMTYAVSHGIFTTDNAMTLYRLDGIDVLLELSNDPTLADTLQKTCPEHITVVDHYEARAIWDMIQADEVISRGLTVFESQRNDFKALRITFEETAGRLSDILKRRNRRSSEIEMDLISHERTLYQIIQGSTIPTFVINREHTITHWNKALERLTGLPGAEMVGTNHHWNPFYRNPRPTMADVILDEVPESEIRKLYCQKWRKSALINGAYEAEDFFPNLGEEGKWCFFTAAPIKDHDGAIIGAIETLWDRTEDKKADQERDRYTRELSTLCSIYAALNAPSGLSERINATIGEVLDFLDADSICIFLMDEEGVFQLAYTHGEWSGDCRESGVVEKNHIIHQVAEIGRFQIVENPDPALDPLVKPSGSRDMPSDTRSIAYIPISTKGRQSLGVIRIGSRHADLFTEHHQSILELIGNRIGVAVENAMLQEQYIKSEQKYRSLFNNDPNPIFIVDTDTLEILDTNRRARDIYGYGREEMKSLSFLSLEEEPDGSMRERLLGLTCEQSILFSKRRHKKQNGQSFFVNINVSRAANGERDVLIANTTDITESVEKETQLIQAAKMTTLGVMAAGMAHEINQPLNVIQICSDMLLKIVKKEGAVDPEHVRDMADEIAANVSRATNVIKHVRDFARQSEVVSHKININDPIEDVFKVMGHQLTVHQIELQKNLDPALPMILADHNRLEQVFINLVTNAVDTMDEKSEAPEIEDKTKRLGIKSFVRNDRVTVTVSDTGMGMSEAVKRKIFEPFFTTKATGKGTGLGTSISYGIIKDYGGTIRVESKPGKGTEFTLSFPAAARGDNAP